MAKRGLRITGFTRFILVLMILIPGAFVGSLLLKGEEVNMENIMKIFNQDKSSEEAISDDTKVLEDVPSEQPSANDDLIKDLKQEIRDLKDEVRNLKRDLLDSEDEIRTLKDRIETLENTSEPSEE